MSGRAMLLLFAAGLVLAGCGGGKNARDPVDRAGPAIPRFEEAAAASGIRWSHNPCRTGKKLLPETYGGGGGFLDYDRDGWLDILLLNGHPLPGFKGPAPRHALYRNLGNRTFQDVTREAGLAAGFYGQGTATGDYDNDGWTDLYVTCVGKNRLYHNDRGRFREVTAAAGVGDPRWSTGAAWIDCDRDGWLDLFVANYVEWSPATDIPCGPEGTRQYCPPHQYRGASPTLFHNNGDGTFTDVSQQAGVLGNPTKTLSVTPCDVNADLWPDLFLANDTEPDVLLINKGDGTFTDRGLEAGVALGTDARATGSMGVDIGEPWNDGRPCIAVGTFVGEGLSLFTPLLGTPASSLQFENVKRAAGTAEPTLPMSTFGAVWSDVDLDGWQDLLLLNGHIDDTRRVGTTLEPYRQPPQLFQNQRNGTFRDVAAAAGLAQPLAGRGLAVGDYDNDGRQDFLAFENGGPVRLWHNVTEPAAAWLAVTLEGSRSPRDGAGAAVTIQSGGSTRGRFTTTARSYLAANDPRVHFGLGPGGQVTRVVVKWPSGTTQTVEQPAGSAVLAVREPAAR